MHAAVGFEPRTQLPPYSYKRNVGYTHASARLTSGSLDGVQDPMDDMW